MCRTKGFFPLATLVLWSLAAGVIAYDTNRDNWSMDGLNAALTGNATQTKAPCSVAEKSAKQYIDMGATTHWNLSTAGALPNIFPVSPLLESCFFARQSRVPKDGSNLQLLAEKADAMKNIIGYSDITNPCFFCVIGVGIALRMEYDIDQQLIPGEWSHPQMLKSGRNDLANYIQLSRTVDDLQLDGFLRSVIHMSPEYF